MGRSAPASRVGTCILAVPLLGFFPWHRDAGSHVPRKSLDQVHAVSMPDATAAGSRSPPQLLPDAQRSLRFRRHQTMLSTRHRAVHFRSSPWSSPDVFKTPSPRRSPPRLLDAAARGGLGPAPASRSRGALPHLLRSKTQSRSRWLQVHLGCLRLSPSCPFRVLHTFLSWLRRRGTPLVHE